MYFIFPVNAHSLLLTMLDFAIEEITINNQVSKAEEDNSLADSFAEEYELAKRVAKQRRRAAKADNRPLQDDETQQEGEEERQPIEEITKRIFIKEKELFSIKEMLEAAEEQTRVEPKKDHTLTPVSCLMDKSETKDSQDEQCTDTGISKVNIDRSQEDTTNIEILEETANQVCKSDVQDDSKAVSYNDRDIKDEQGHETKKKKTVHLKRLLGKKKKKSVKNDHLEDDDERSIFSAGSTINKFMGIRPRSTPATSIMGMRPKSTPAPSRLNRITKDEDS